MYSNYNISGNANLDYGLSPDAQITKVGNNAINIDIPLGIPLGPSMWDCTQIWIIHIFISILSVQFQMGSFYHT